MKALIVNCQRNGLGICRSLGKMGVTVLAADHYRTSPGLYSKYVAKQYIISKPAAGEETFIKDLIQIGEKNSTSDEPLFLIPVNDEYILTMVRNWSAIKPYYTPLFETNLGDLLQCTNKNKTNKLANSCNVPIPSSWINPSIETVDKEGNYPFVIKPDSKRSPENIQKEVFRIRFCSNRSELQNAINNLQNKDVPYIIQEYIPGPDSELYTAGIFAWNGELIAGFTGRKLRQFPPSTGEACLAEIVHEPKLLKYSRSLIKPIQFTGIAQIEFKKHGGEFFLMEINPRSWSWNALADHAGVNLPWAGCQTILNEKPAYSEQTNFSGTWSYLFMDLYFNRILSNNMPLSTILKDSFTADIHAFWHVRDPLPAFIAIINSFKLTLRLIKRKIHKIMTGT